MTTGRLTFSDSPWPDGHPLDLIELTVRGGSDGELRLHLHAETVPYDAEPPREDAATDSEWQRPGAWVNYGSAIISSIKWDNAGIELPIAAETFTESMLDGLELSADPVKRIKLDGVAEELAFGCFVLGQGLCGDHTIKLSRVAPNTFDLRWTGALAATFIGEEDFSAGHRFELVADGVRLS
ncbi:hypothetical protein HJ590_05575 [Naumannella sp. ID2617S]|nr:hypothetical protein [Naumannella sp. ID2617S]